MPVPEGWQINPDWPSDMSGIVGYFHDASLTTRNKTLFDVDGWRFFLGGEGDVKVLEYKNGNALVILGGDPYLVRPSEKRVLLPRISCIDLAFVTYVVSHNIVVAVRDYGSAVVAIGPDGLVWEAHGRHYDDITKFDVTDSTLSIEMVNDWNREVYAVELSLDTGREL